MYFYKTHGGAELDLYWSHGGKNWGAEFKYGDAPSITKSMRFVMADLDIERLWVVYPGKEAYALDKDISVLPLGRVTCPWDYSH